MIVIEQTDDLTAMALIRFDGEAYSIELVEPPTGAMPLERRQIAGILRRLADQCDEWDIDQ